MNDKEFKPIYSYHYKLPTQKVNLTGLLNTLHDMQLNMIDEAVEISDLRDAKELIQYIKNKRN